MTANNKLHQINTQYSKQEDRILLRTSTTNHEEYRIWLTRRYTALLLDLLNKEMEKRGGTTTIVEQKQTKSMFQQGAFEKPYQEEHTSVQPLGDEGILAYALKTAADKEGNLMLDIRSEAGKGITYHLNDSLIYMFYSLLTQCSRIAGWKLSEEPDNNRASLH